ncbi:MAG: hypothetical protein P1V19_00085 [Gimesia sp.]|nr:hypothetical protein [Gimesia sp.]
MADLETVIEINEAIKQRTLAEGASAVLMSIQKISLSKQKLM